MTAERTPELPEGFSYEQGRETRQSPEMLHPDHEYRLRFRDPQKGFFEREVVAKTDLERGADCDAAYVEVRCQGLDCGIELQFSRETGCIVQRKGSSFEEIGYIVSMKSPPPAVPARDRLSAVVGIEGGMPTPPPFIR